MFVVLFTVVHLLGLEHKHTNTRGNTQCLISGFVDGVQLFTIITTENIHFLCILLCGSWFGNIFT